MQAVKGLKRLPRRRKSDRFGAGVFPERKAPGKGRFRGKEVKQMSVLKKIGIFLAGAASDITKVMGFPFISQLLGVIPGKLGQEVRTVTGDLNTFAGITSFVESAFPSIDGAKTGSQKLNVAAPVVQKVVLLWAESNLPGHNKVIVDPEKFAADCKALTSAFADVFNDFGE